ncbi:purine-nucleoside phosphorylase [candidate division TA06 bacterium]|uniref:Purine nucleoside phosphorylase n=1 Tax=candidate division TA06 bacterium TaxID=2250710 RepID=A0A523XS24_UNCT6|nr:MAG: purine-nucleoside phosphorylase [candidate division TA06 bacterium]
MVEGMKAAREAFQVLSKKVQFKPGIGIILGTGLGRLAEDIKGVNEVSYEDIPNFPVSTVESHAGRFIFGNLSGKKVVAMQGRFHYYEGYSMQDIVLPIRVMKLLGIKVLIVSNACGGINPLFSAGDIMLIADHINLLGQNPLIGLNDESIGPRFPDMYNCYDGELAQVAVKVALEEGIDLKTGVYAALSGPNLETAAEYRMLRIIGADVVGMSTVPEVIAARHMGIKVIGFSVITDMGLPDALGPMNLEKIIATANRSEPILTKLIGSVTGRIRV